MKRKLILYSLIFFGLFLAFSFPSKGQKMPDTLSIKLDTAEKYFLQKNLSLMASHFNIDIQDALVLQARLWSNPNFEFGQGAYNTADHRLFELHGPNSIQSVQLQQLFLLAGKRNKQIKIAETNTQISRYAYFDLIRTLKSQLRSDFYSIYYLQQSSKVYDREIQSLEKISRVFTEQVLKGNIAKKEEIRIKSQLFSLQNEYVALRQQILGYEADLNLLLMSQNVYYKPDLEINALGKFNSAPLELGKLIDSALVYRYDLKSSESNVMLNQQTLSLQKALAIPDLTVGLNYASNGSAAPNYFLLFASIDLPFFNRNQGNIKSAKFQVNQSQIQLQAQQQTVQHDVSLALNTVLENQKVFRDFNPQFLSDYDKLIDEVLKNYTSRNLGLLDFLDFYDSYKQNILQANTLQLNLVNAYEQINFAVGKDIIH
jgi:cobalt-zinc-cadmium efflux system outer membrane protein